MRGSAVAMFVLVGFGLACSGGVPGSACTIGTTQCEDDKLSVCNANGSWEQTMECPTGTSCGEASGVQACIPDDANGAAPGDGMGGGEGGGGGGGGGGGEGKAGKRKAGGRAD